VPVGLLIAWYPGRAAVGPGHLYLP